MSMSNYARLAWKYKQHWNKKFVANFIQLISLQLVDQSLQTKLCWKAPNEGYLHICRMYKIGNKKPRYQIISSYKSFIC